MRAAVAELVEQGVPVGRASGALGVPRSSYYRGQQPAHEPKATTERAKSPRALSDDERIVVRDLLNSEPHMDQSPRQVKKGDVVKNHIPLFYYATRPTPHPSKSSYISNTGS